jgi:orotate phosphoribosyltransferase
MTVSERIAEALLDIDAIHFSPEKPFRFKSGILSPLYVDNRLIPSHPTEWSCVIHGLMILIEKKQLEFDVIAGIETAGIPHASALSYALKKPSVFVRKTLKEHGRKKLIEGGDVQGKRVLLIEDHISTGESSLAGVRALKEAGAKVEICLAITSYEFEVALDAFKAEGVQFFTLTTFSLILAAARKRKLLLPEQVDVITDWLADPQGWGKRHGFED